MKLLRRVGLLIGLLLMGLMSGCSTPKTYFHTLNVEQDNPKTFPDISKRLNSLGVGPVDLPGLLDRQGLVLRRDAFTVDVSEQHLWGGQLEEEFLRSLANSLQIRLPETHIQTVPWDLEQTPQLQLSLNILQFDGILGGSARLRGSWQLQQGESGKLVKKRAFSLQAKTLNDSVGGIVRAQSSLINQLADHIIQGL